MWQYHVNGCAVKAGGDVGWNGEGYQLADCSSRAGTLLRDRTCREDCHVLFAEFKERKTIFRAVVLVKEIAASLRFGLNILFGQVGGCS